MRQTPAAVLVPVLLAAALLGGWWWLWYSPARAEIDRMRREISSLRGQTDLLRAEIERLERSDLSVPVETLGEAERLWARIAGLIEAAGFRVERIELSSGSAADLSASAPQRNGGRPGPEGVQPAPPSPQQPGGQQAPVAPRAPQAVGGPVAIVRVGLRFEGSYVGLRDVVERVSGSVPGAAWVRMEMEGKGDGNVTVNAELAIVAVASPGGGL